MARQVQWKMTSEPVVKRGTTLAGLRRVLLHQLNTHRLDRPAYAHHEFCTEPLHGVLSRDRISWSGTRRTRTILRRTGQTFQDAPHPTDEPTSSSESARR